MTPDVDIVPFHPTTFLSGATSARGMFEDRFGRVRREFLITLNGAWEGSTFVLDEEFLYDDGERETRQWRIVGGDDRQFTATCADCVGIAQGTSHARYWRMRYNFRLRMGRRSVVVSFDDRVHRADARLAINRATVRKWGIRLGEVFIVMEKRAQD